MRNVSIFLLKFSAKKDIILRQYKKIWNDYMEKVKITIAGIPYTIATDNNPEYTINLANEIESKINSIMKNGSFVSPTQATALVILDYADQANKLAEENENMKQQLKEYLADAAQAKSERDMLRREMAKIKKGCHGEF